MPQGLDACWCFRRSRLFKNGWRSYRCSGLHAGCLCGVSKPIVCGTHCLPIDGQNSAIVIAESLARVIAAIRITSVCGWRSYLPPKHRIGPHRPCVCCVAIRSVRLAFIRVTLFHMKVLRSGQRELIAFAWTLAIGDCRISRLWRSFRNFAVEPDPKQLQHRQTEWRR